MEYISSKTAPRGDRRERAPAKKKANKGSWLQRKDFFLTEEEERDVERDGGEAWWRQNLRHLFKKQVYRHARPHPLLILVLLLLAHPFQITARVAREDQTSRAVLFIFYHPSYSLRRERKRRSEREPHWETGGRKGEEKQNNLLFPPPLSGWICRSLTNYKHTRTVVCNRCACNCSSWCT